MKNWIKCIQIHAKSIACMFMRTPELGVLAFESCPVFAASAETFTFGTTALTMCWEKGSDGFWEPFRADTTDYPTLSTFLWPLSSIAHSLNSAIAQCFCKIGGNLWWVEQNRAQEVDPTKFSLPRQTARPHDFRRENIPYLLSDFSIFVIRSGGARAIKSVEFIFSAGFDGAILWPQR